MRAAKPPALTPSINTLKQGHFEVAQRLRNLIYN